MAEMNKATVHASERVSARDMIQTQFEGDEDLSLMTDKDVAKMKKKAEKDERAARAALAAHQVRSSHLCLALIPVCLFIRMWSLSAAPHLVLPVQPDVLYTCALSLHFLASSHNDATFFVQLIRSNDGTLRQAASLYRHCLFCTLCA